MKVQLMDQKVTVCRVHLVQKKVQFMYHNFPCWRGQLFRKKKEQLMDHKIPFWRLPEIWKKEHHQVLWRRVSVSIWIFQSPQNFPDDSHGTLHLCLYSTTFEFTLFILLLKELINTSYKAVNSYSQSTAWS